ncbi:peptidoglycan recognition protein family protein [Cytobacillus gottheilii]|uniref:peptidoglycan recognition protein family protein n=1 Tax=Cytobacillus gottheilii TaxID=859144 RepID=UPI0015947593|nr:peptidoglycan recognition family protein [Cytobacillus gottheilii]
MAIKDLPKYKDIRNTIRRNGRYPYVGTACKDTIVIHHSLTAMKLAGSTPQAFANTHIDKNGWHGCAYPFVITWEGTIWQTDDLDRRTYHAGNTNTRSIGICVAGDFRKGKEKPTDAQILSLYLLIKELQRALPKLTRILGHQECPGYSWKNCPGDNWSYKDVVAGKFIATAKKNGWLKENSTWFYYANNVAKTGWHKDKSMWYYLKPEMATGWIKDKGKWYFLAANGTMQTGWVKDKSKWYYLNPSGDMVVGWKVIDGQWYFFDNDGSMKTGWLKHKNTSYYLHRSGVMITGWLCVDGKWYFFNPNGKMAQNAQLEVQSVTVNSDGSISQIN